MRALCIFAGDPEKGKPGTVWKRPCSQGVKDGKVERAKDCEGCDLHIARPTAVTLHVEFESAEPECRWGVDLTAPEAQALGLNPLRHYKRCCHAERPLKADVVCPDGGCGPKCGGYQVEPEVATEAEVVFNMAAGGLGDGVQGLAAVGAYRRDNPGVTVVYRVGKVAIPFVALFDGYDVLREHEWDHNASRTLSGPDVQLNAGFWEAETPGGISRLGRYMREAGVTTPEPYRLREPERLAGLGRGWAGVVVLCPFSAGTDREYSVFGWLAVERLLRERGYRTVVLHRNPERYDPLVSPKLIGRPPEEVVGLLLNAACVIGVDSGLPHLAAALGRPTLVLTGQTKGQQVFDNYPSARWLSGELTCSGCYWKPPRDERVCAVQCASLQAITPERIAHHVAEMTGGPEGAKMRAALGAVADAPPPYPGGSGRGLLTAGEGAFWPMTVAMIRSVRKTGCTLPIEVWFRGGPEGVRPEDVAGLGVRLIDADAMAERDGDRPEGGAWEGKLYALARTRFETAVWLDADVQALEDPTFLADLADGHGFVTWTDTSHEGQRHLRWGELWPAGPGASLAVTSGQIGVNRRLVWRELATAHWVGQNSGYYFQRMLGDQDAWRLAFAVTGGTALNLGEMVKLPIKHLYRFDHGGRPVILHRSGPKLLPVPGFAAADAEHLGWFRDAVAAGGDGPALEALAGDTLVRRARLQVIRDSVIATNHLPGALAEFGVFKGGTARVIGAFAPGAELHLFDTFAGMPEDDEDGIHTRGEFAVEFDAVRAAIGNPAAVYHVGRFPAALPPEGTRFRFVHLDCDLYQSVRAGLEYFCPRMVPGGIMLIDDYNAATCPGAKRAVTEYGLPVVPTTDTQALARF